MRENINETVCPLCLKDNQCDVANSCWCKVVDIPAQLVQLVPTSLKNKTCICNACVISFNHDPALFVKKQRRISSKLV